MPTLIPNMPRLEMVKLPVCATRRACQTQHRTRVAAPAQATGRGSHREVGRAQLVVACLASELLDVRGDPLQPQLIHVRHQWRQQPRLGLDRHVDVYVVVLSDETVHPRGVELWDITQRQRRSLHDEVVDRNLVLVATCGVDLRPGAAQDTAERE